MCKENFFGIFRSSKEEARKDKGRCTEESFGAKFLSGCVKKASKNAGSFQSSFIRRIAVFFGCGYFKLYSE